MRIVLLFLFTYIALEVNAQKVINKEIEVKGDIKLKEGISIPKINKGYTLWIPDGSSIKGLIVFTHPRRDTANSDFIIDYALDKGLAILYAITENRLEFFFDNKSMQEIERYIHEVILKYNIPKDHLLYCGMSLEGTRALKLAIYGQSKISKHQLIPKAIAICDSPLDMLRFHKEMLRSKNLNFNPIATNEGNWVSAYLEKNLGGTPEEAYQEYVDYSPYCYAANGGTNIKYFKDIAIRCYTEPDVNWWIETRRKDYYSMNAIDLAALINELRILGNDKVELIVTQNKGFHDNGERHPHSWNIVDEQNLVNWFLNLIQ